MSLIEHAKNEIEILNTIITDDEEKEYNDMINRDVLELITTLSNQNHSGHSVNAVINRFNRLAMYNTIVPITLNDDEFGEVFDLRSNMRQNKRISSIFKYGDENKYKYLDAFSFNHRYIKTLDSDKIIDDNRHCYWAGNGQIIVDGSGGEIKFVGVLEGLSFTKEKFESLKGNDLPKYKINAIHIDVDSSGCEIFIFKNDLKTLQQFYDLSIRELNSSDMRDSTGCYKGDEYERLIQEFIDSLPKSC